MKYELTDCVLEIIRPEVTIQDKLAKVTSGAGAVDVTYRAMAYGDVEFTITVHPEGVTITDRSQNFTETYVAKGTESGGEFNNYDVTWPLDSFSYSVMTGGFDEDDTNDFGMELTLIIDLVTGDTNFTVEIFLNDEMDSYSETVMLGIN